MRSVEFVMNSMIKKVVIGILCLFYPMMSFADIIDDIANKKELLVGVKADYKPYGFVDESGNFKGIEVELARDVADKLNVQIKFVTVVSANRMQYLSDGKVDLMIATMTDKPDRRKIVFASDPNYYSSGTNVIAKKSDDFNQWEELSGKKVCGINGAFYNKAMRDKYGATLITFDGTKAALNALKQQQCSAFVYDDSFVAGLLTDEKWSAEYEMPFETIDDAPWALAVRNGEDRFHAIMNEMIIDWHKTGRILGLEAKYGIKNTSFAIRMHQKFNEILKIHK
jgi:polar amino acid transport system substrate-binding protein